MTDAAAGTTARVLVLVDESGSMMGHAAGTIEQLNSYLDSLARLPGTTLVTLATFEGHRGYNLRFKDVPAQGTVRFANNPYLTRSMEGLVLGQSIQYLPHLGGGTPLFDSLAKLIYEVADTKPALVAVLTDGEENQSKEWHRASIAELIKNREKLSGWTFAFLMAGFDKMQAEQYTQSFGGNARNTMSYNKGQEFQATQSMVGATATWRSGSATTGVSSGSIYSDAGVLKDLAPSENEKKQP